MKLFAFIMNTIGIICALFILIFIYLAYQSPEDIGPMMCKIASLGGTDYSECRAKQSHL